MSRLKRLLHVADPSLCNTQQVPVQTCMAVAQQAHTMQQGMLHVAHPSPCNTQQGSTELFQFNPPGDPANDAEAVTERAAIFAVENGWDDATALQEARWQTDRKRCWRVFLNNATRILEAPAHQTRDLLTRYREEAIRRYGERTGMDMAQSLRGWVEARRVH